MVASIKKLNGFVAGELLFGTGALFYLINTGLRPYLSIVGFFQPDTLWWFQFYLEAVTTASWIPLLVIGLDIMIVSAIQRYYHPRSRRIIPV